MSGSSFPRAGFLSLSSPYNLLPALEGMLHVKISWQKSFSYKAVPILVPWGWIRISQTQFKALCHFMSKNTICFNHTA